LVLALGVVGYLICVRLTTRGTELVDYMGISSMGSVSVAALPWLIKRAFLAYRDFFLGSSGGAHPAFLKYAFALTTAATAGLGVAILREKRLNWQRILLLVLLIAAYPLAGNLIYLMAPAAEVHLLMVYGMVYILLAPLAAAEYAGTLTAEGPARGKIYAVLRALCCWVIAGTLAVTAFGYAVYTNAAYLKMDLSYEQAYAYSIRLVSAIEGADGYAEGMPVVLVGEALGESGQKANPELDALQMAGVADMKELVNSYSYGHFLRRFTGLASPVYTAGTDVSARYAALESVERMSAYPAQGSVLVIDGHIVVKFA
ncbi:MAG: glucosyltransferase domain-containing protein, partial [Bacillota bacterium]